MLGDPLGQPRDVRDVHWTGIGTSRGLNCRGGRAGVVVLVPGNDLPRGCRRPLFEYDRDTCTGTFQCVAKWEEGVEIDRESASSLGATDPAEGWREGPVDACRMRVRRDHSSADRSSTVASSR
ncbi:ferredoxin [Halobacterium wangiae]|uniref:ferredoxin n=1 Tax=Halobacterium wangiae TaxID=2902623 RepID=UPI003D7B3863